MIGFPPKGRTFRQLAAGLAVKACWCYSTLRDALCGAPPVYAEFPPLGRVCRGQFDPGRAVSQRVSCLSSEAMTLILPNPSLGA